MVKIRGKLKNNGGRPSKYNPTYPLQVYRMIKEKGMSVEAAAEALGTSGHTIVSWGRKYPEMKRALEDAKKPDGGLNIQNYIYGRLEPRLQHLWKQLKKCEDHLHPAVMIEAILERQGKTARQSLFIFAWVNSCFSVNKALKAVNIDKKTFDAWCREEDFMQMVAQIHWHKKNFVEDALMKCIERGETNAIIFASKTLNRDRGFNERVELEINGGDAVVVTPISELNLSLDARREMLEEMRRRNKPRLKETAGEVVD